MVRTDRSNIKITFLEKIIVNWSLPYNLLHNTCKSYWTQNEYYHQTIPERAREIARGKVEKYHKLLIVKKEYGEIPERIVSQVIKWPCAKTRYYMALLRSHESLYDEL